MAKTTKKNQSKPKKKAKKPTVKIGKKAKPGKEPKGKEVPEPQVLNASVFETDEGLGPDGETLLMAWFVEYNRVGKSGRNKMRLDAETLADAKFEAASLLGISEADVKEDI